MIATKHLGLGKLGVRMKCDHCGKIASKDSDSLKSNIDLFKRDGWTVYHSEAEWKHECPLCGDATEEQKKAFQEKTDRYKKFNLKQ